MARKRATAAEPAEQSDDRRKSGEPAEVVRYWLDEIGSAKKREKDWRKEGQRILEIYDGTKAEQTPFNILFSNTETITPATYSAIPRPVVQRRFKDDDPLGRLSATAGQRMLEFLVDTNIDGYETFNEGMKAANLDAALPGRGVTSVKYDYNEIILPPADGSMEGTPSKDAELACVNSRAWNRVYFGYARKWSKVPWVVYEEYLDREECERLFGKDVADLITYTEGEDAGEEEGEGKRTAADDRDMGQRKTACVYQIWDKEGGKVVRYISPTYIDGFCKVQDDPLGLTGFFDCPRPLQFVEKNDMKPVAPYKLYEKQAKELNRLTIRISKVTEAIKARGAYDGAMGDDLANIMKGDDNELVPAQRSSSIAYEKGLQNAIWFMPLAELIVVLEKLLVAREQCKQTIYEIMGIADIMRGASKASETLGAQQIKSQWGTLRIKPKQSEVQRYARDLLRIMLEIAATKFSEETWAQMTGLPFLTTQQAQQAQAVAQAAQQQAAMTGQPPDPKIMAILQQPKWSDILGLLKNDMQRAYRIDIETNSTIEPEAAEDQKQIADLMMALSQFIQGIAPLIEKGVMPFEAAQTMLLAITRRFRFGSEIEDQLKAMKPPAPQDDGAAAQAQQAQMQAEQKVAAAEQQVKQLQAEAKLNEKANELAIREIKLESDEAIFKLEQQAAKESITLRDQVGQNTLKNEQKVTSLIDSQARREQQVNDKSQSKIAESIQSLKQTREAVVESGQQILEALKMNSDQMQMLLTAVLKAVSAARVRVPVRGKDGRIQQVIDKPAGDGAILQ